MAVVNVMEPLVASWVQQALSSSRLEGVKTSVLVILLVLDVDWCLIQGVEDSRTRALSGVAPESAEVACCDVAQSYPQ